MLQIVSGKFFRDVELRDYTHRRVLYTNAQFVSRDAIVLPMATLRPSTDMEPVTTLAVELYERLEAVQRNGEPEVMVATSGDEFLADLAFVLSFALNATVSADVDQVRRLIPRTLDDRDRSTPAHILRRTCDPRVFIQNREIDDLLPFVEQLVALNRRNFDLAMKAIRQVVNACRRAADDPSLAYTMFVASLESLSGGVEPPPVTWVSLDPRMRRLIDPSLDGLAEDVRERIRTAILEAERAGATRRFVAFVLTQVSPAYYREQAVDAVRPVSAFHLPKLLGRAYGIRSKNVHILEDLPPEAWVFTGRADSVNPAGRGLILSLEGFNRLARHAIRGFVANASTVQEEPFDYRSALPGVLRIEFSPEYWVGFPEGLSADTAARYLQGFAEVLVSTLGSSGESPTAGEPTDSTRPINVDMRPLLSRIEELVPLTGGPSARRSMIAIYFLWHRIMKREFHLPSAPDFLARHSPQLEKPSMQALVVATLLKAQPHWSTSDFEQLAQQRLRDRAGDSEPFPAVFDAALAAAVAMRLASDGRRDEAADMLSRAVEESPGNARLMASETEFLEGGPLEVDLTALVLGVPLPDPDDAAPEPAPHDTPTAEPVPEPASPEGTVTPPPAN